MFSSPTAFLSEKQLQANPLHTRVWPGHDPAEPEQPLGAATAALARRTAQPLPAQILPHVSLVHPCARIVTPAQGLIPGATLWVQNQPRCHQCNQRVRAPPVQ